MHFPHLDQAIRDGCTITATRDYQSHMRRVSVQSERININIPAQTLEEALRQAEREYPDARGCGYGGCTKFTKFETGATKPSSQLDAWILDGGSLIWQLCPDLLSVECHLRQDKVDDHLVSGVTFSEAYLMAAASLPPLPRI